MNLIPFAIIIAIILVVWEIFGEEKLRPWLVAGLAFIIGMTVFGNYSPQPQGGQQAARGRLRQQKL